MLSFICLLLLFFCSACGSQPVDFSDKINQHTQLKVLLSKANEKKLSEASYWHRLLHYEKKLMGIESEITTQGFFLSPDGKYHAQHELEATLLAFQQEVPSDVKKHNEHAICKFPLRYLWLNSALGGAFTHPQLQCQALNEFLTRLAPQSATLLFSAYHLKSPASAFGHTFLKLNQGNRQHELNDFGIGYAANVDTENALFYAIKGLLGLFPGSYTALPYYYKVREYNDYEARDIWEYQLNLTPSEVSLLTLHLWELGTNTIPYYYLSKNCSYQMLGLLEIARPSISLLNQLSWPVLPMNTIQAAREANLIEGIKFRPSIRTVLMHRAGMSSELAIDTALHLNDDMRFDLSQLQPKDRAFALDLALDIFDLKNAKALVHQGEENQGIVAQRQLLLERRSEESFVTPKLQLSTPERPDFAHYSRRVEGLFSYSQKEGFYQSLHARLNFHDLSDPPAGHPNLAQMQFFSFKSRIDWVNQHFRPESLQIVEAMSLSRMSVLEPRVSWNFRLGAGEKNWGKCPSCWVGSMLFRSGISFGTANEYLIVYLLMDLELQGGNSLHFYQLPISLGLGGSMGLRWRLGSNVVWHTYGQYRYWLEKQFQQSWQGNSDLKLGINDHLAFYLFTQYFRFDQRAGLGLSIYF